MDHLIGKDIRKDEEEVQVKNIEKHATLDNIRNDTNTMGELDNLDVDACEYVVKNDNKLGLSCAKLSSS